MDNWHCCLQIGSYVHITAVLERCVQFVTYELTGHHDPADDRVVQFANAVHDHEYGLYGQEILEVCVAYLVSRVCMLVCVYVCECLCM